MIQKIFLSVFTIVMFYAGPGLACMTANNSLDLKSYDILIDFNDGAANGLKNGVKVTNQWEGSGVTFGDGTMKWSEYTFLGTPGLYGSFDTGSIGSIYFSKDVSAAAFQFFTLPTWSSSIIIQAKNNGNVVGSINIPKSGNWCQSDRWYSFAEITFDEIDFNTGALYWNIDNLRFTPVPIPSAILMLCSGLFGLIGLKKKLAI